MSTFGARFRRLLQQPGSADLARYERLLPAIEAREAELGEAEDGTFRDLAREARDDADFCAVGREAARRALGERPFDVQLIGTLAMLQGQIAEMATGEGKTLAGALAAARYALTGRSVQVASVNDYLAQRDAEWMRPLYDLLGVTVGHITAASTPQQRREAYDAQVTYAPISEIGFDVLRDRLVTDPADLVAAQPDVLLIDEADSVLIDEALVPLVLAGAAAGSDSDLEMAEVVRALRPGLHYETDDDGRNATLTDEGARAAERALGGIDLYAADQIEALTRLNVALHAHALLRRDVDYIIRDGEVRLISASRGRVAELQRWPDGLQAAVEAKEGIAASESGEILDSITVESLVRRYPRVCGMTGTAVTVGDQLRQFYGLEVAVILPNKPCVREDEPDRLYATMGQKDRAIVAEVAGANATGQPVLIGTLDIAESERLSRRLTAAGLEHVVLNAKNDAHEAAIVAEAGAYGAITVSTQMAGRGTDIRLGGSEGGRGEAGGAGGAGGAGNSEHDRVAELGGLYVIGTGRHASSRLDNQLRGRSGRQGDPGDSVFFVSMEDELITSYAPDTAAPRDVAADGRVRDAKAAEAVAHAQRVADGANLEIHRNTYRYHELIEKQREIVLEHRDRLMRGDAALVALGTRCPERFEELSATVDEDVLAAAARTIVLYHLDRGWADHLAELADIREGIHLRALGTGALGGGRDPLGDFQTEAVKLFTSLLDRVQEEAAETFRTASITEAGVDLDASGLKRPTATWTYVVQDNPFGSAMERAMRRLAGRKDRQ
ncbi:MAG TPA: accessory Sec system translocase SecA2 [Streptosporangiaceae bacterium]|nr:accessory Sec system translocase SecA2 [Streptosporangiaceae bacterium]